MPDELNPKQERFCQEYAVNGNAKQSAITAGYSAKNAESIGCRLSSNIKVKTRVGELLSKRENKVIITADYVLESLKEVADRCKQAIPVMEKVNGELKATGEWRFDSAGANRALELLGKNLRLFIDKVEHSGGTTNTTLYQIVINARGQRGLDNK